jgi:hypothetical protein
MKNPKTDRIIYSISVGDLQEVSQEVLERRLTKSELDQVQASVGDYIDWFQAIENAIRERVPE